MKQYVTKLPDSSSQRGDAVWASGLGNIMWEQFNLHTLEDKFTESSLLMDRFCFEDFLVFSHFLLSHFRLPFMVLQHLDKGAFVYVCVCVCGVLVHRSF